MNRSRHVNRVGLTIIVNILWFTNFVWALYRNNPYWWIDGLCFLASVFLLMWFLTRRI